MNGNNETSETVELLWEELLAFPAARRGGAVRHALSMQPDGAFDPALPTGRLRALLAECWELFVSTPVPISHLRTILQPPLDTDFRIRIGRFNAVGDNDQLLAALELLFKQVGK
jgi:hypothetical protein